MTRPPEGSGHFRPLMLLYGTPEDRMDHSTILPQSCAECGVTFTPAYPGNAFCTLACGRAYYADGRPAA